MKLCVMASFEMAEIHWIKFLKKKQNENEKTDLH